MADVGPFDVILIILLTDVIVKVTVADLIAISVLADVIANVVMWDDVITHLLMYYYMLTIWQMLLPIYFVMVHVEPLMDQ